jgi:putative NIF3 family GTP cyclohydrolase 1 type 2
MIISYHPPIFKPLSSLTLASPLQASLLSCATHGISVYSPHTALDCTLGGVNDWLASGIIGETSPLGEISHLGERKVGMDLELEGGEGRLVRLAQPIGMAELEQRIKGHLGLSHSPSANFSRRFG